jgi:Fe(3+) dicitrate transport protein
MTAPASGCILFPGRMIIFCACFFLALAAAAAQAPRATVVVRALDPSGAVLADATVTLRPLPEGEALAAVPTDAGEFTAAGLQQGEWELRVEAPGFAAHTRRLQVAGRGAVLVVTLFPETTHESVTVTATHIIGPPELARTIAGSIEVLDRRTLETARVLHFGEALRKVAGLNVREEEGFGLRPNIGVRGLNPARSTKVLLLEDGMPLAYAPYGDNASYYHPPIERFEAIEVLKGAGQVLYGPSTVGAVINYITPRPPAGKLGGSVSLLGGSHSYFNGGLALGGTWGRTGVLLDALRKQGDGARENVSSRLNDLNLKVSSELNARHSLSLRGNFYREDSNVTYSGLRQDEWEANPRQNPFRNDFFFGRRWGGNAVHTYVVSSQILLSTSAYGSYFRRHWWRQSSNSGQRPNDPACSMAELNTICGNQGRLRSYHTWGVAPQVKAHHRLLGVGGEATFGARLHFENQDRRQENGPLPTSRSGVVVEDNERTNQAYAGFLQNRFILGRWSLTPGVRVEHVRYQRANRLLDVRGRTRLTQVIPGVGVAYSPAESTTFFAGAHRGFAPPRTEDIIHNTTGGVVELDPELSWNYEAGARTTAWRGLRLDATFFRMDYENQIVPASLAGGLGAALTNGGRTLHQGLEFTLRADTAPLLGWRHNFYTTLSQTELLNAEFRGTRFSNVPGFGQVSVTGNRLPYAPRRLLTAGLGYSHPRGFEALVEAVHVSRQFADDLNTVAPSADGQRGLLPAYTTWNVTANYHVEPWRSTLFVTVKNAGDSLFLVDRARGMLPGSPRQVHGGLRVRF